MNLILDYHERTKHHIYNLARSLGFLDWKNQPDPFRYYLDAEKIKLTFLAKEPDLKFRNLFIANKNTKEFDLENIGGFLELSLGLSAWKSYLGNKWALRINPSSGNLHPTEAHLILLVNDRGIYHYLPYNHTLEKRADIPNKTGLEILDEINVPGFFVALTSIYWREAWKYGERAYRYCNHDLGHALAAISIAANLFGWKVTYLSDIGDNEISKILGFDKINWIDSEEENPEILCYIHPPKYEFNKELSSGIINKLSVLDYKNKINQLSKDRINWDIIYRAANFTKKPRTKPFCIKMEKSRVNDNEIELLASKIIRQRRSAVDYNLEKSIMDKEVLLDILDKTIPRENIVPFDIKIIEPNINLLLFIHNVKEIKQGLYFFLRNLEDKKNLQNLSKEFIWKEVGSRLYILKEGSYRDIARMVSCNQDIASDSCFSLGMIANFKEIINKPYIYRNIHWESGLIGQVMYLCAEAHGFRATGIGCFFDDEVHKILNLKNNNFRTVYHFTIGYPIEDRRLQTHEPYYHIEDKN